MKHRLTLIAACLAVIALTSACSSNDAPAPKPTGSASHAPTMPALAKEHTEAGAEAFVRHFLEAMNESQETGNVDAFLRLSGPDCTNCEYIANTIDFVKKAGGHYTGGQWIPHSFTIDFDEKQTIVSLMCEIQEGTVTKSKDAEPKNVKPRETELHFDLTYSLSEKTWTVNEIGSDIT